MAIEPIKTVSDKIKDYAMYNDLLVGEVKALTTGILRAYCNEDRTDAYMLNKKAQAISEMEQDTDKATLERVIQLLRGNLTWFKDTIPGCVGEISRDKYGKRILILHLDGNE